MTDRISAMQIYTPGWQNIVSILPPVCFIPGWWCFIAYIQEVLLQKTRILVCLDDCTNTWIFRSYNPRIGMECFCIISILLKVLKFYNIQLPLRLRSGFFLEESIWAYAVLSCYLTLALNAWQSYLCFIPWSWFISIFTVIRLTNGRSTTEILVIFGSSKGKEDAIPSLLSLQWWVFGLLLKQYNSALAAFLFLKDSCMVFFNRISWLTFITICKCQNTP